MSRAFIKEVEPETIELPDRAVSSHPNLVTAEGLAAIERTLSRFEEATRAAIAKNDRGDPTRSSILERATIDRKGH
jgi:hypothetical protein